MYMYYVHVHALFCMYCSGVLVYLILKHGLLYGHMIMYTNAMEQLPHSTQYTITLGVILQCFKRWFLWILCLVAIGGSFLNLTQIMYKSYPYLAYGMNLNYLLNNICVHFQCSSTQ